jgi:hypothetical protein
MILNGCEGDKDAFYAFLHILTSEKWIKIIILRPKSHFVTDIFLYLKKNL